MPITNAATLPPHKTKHQTGGADEVSIASLLGSPAQKAAASGLASLSAGSLVVQKPADRLSKANFEITLNKLLKGAGAGADPTEIDVPSGGAYTQVVKVHISTSCDYVDFTSLDINSKLFYELLIRWTNGGASAGIISIFVNGDYEPTNYVHGHVEIDSGDNDGAGDYPNKAIVPSAGRSAFIAYTQPGLTAVLKVTVIRGDDNRFRVLLRDAWMCGDYTNNRFGALVGHNFSRVNHANITSIRIAAQYANGIGAGSDFILTAPV